MFKFEDLRVYQSALNFNQAIFDLTRSWPKDEVFGLTSQFRRASNSINLNIAEGTSRTNKDFGHFIDMARGSCYECVAILHLAKRRGYIETQDYNDLYQQCHQLSRMLNALKLAILPTETQPKTDNQ